MNQFRRSICMYLSDPTTATTMTGCIRSATARLVPIHQLLCHSITKRMSKTPGTNKAQPIVPASTSPLRTRPSYKRTSTNPYGTQKGKMQMRPSGRSEYFQCGIQLQNAQKMQTRERKEATATTRCPCRLTASSKSNWLIACTMFLGCGRVYSIPLESIERESDSRRVALRVEFPAGAPGPYPSTTRRSRSSHESKKNRKLCAGIRKEDG